MDVFIERENKTKIVNFNGLVYDLLKILELNLDDVLIIRNGELVSEDEELVDSDNIKIVSVISGG